MIHTPKKYDFVIGIDAGVHTGYAVRHGDSGRLLEVQEMKIHQAMQELLRWEFKNDTLVRVEDARQRKWYGGSDALQEKWGAGIREGIGSVKRDCQIWDDFLKDWGFHYEMVAPKNNRTKVKSAQFKLETGWTARTNEHMRDAAYLCLKFNFK